MRHFSPAVVALLALALTAPLRGADAPTAPVAGDIRPGEPVTGPKIGPGSFQKRVVVLAAWDGAHPDQADHTMALVDLQKQHPDGKVMVVANCPVKETGGSGAGKESLKKAAKEAAKIWLENDHAGQVPVILGGGLPGDKPDAPGQVRVFDCLGKQVYQGTLAPADAPDLSKAISAAVKFAGSGLSRQQVTAQQRARELFGDDLPADLVKAAAALADPARPSEPTLKFLENGAKSKKNAILAAQAKGMIEAFDKAIAAQFQEAVALAETDPPQAHALMLQLTRWVPQKKEGAQAKAQLAQWAKSKPFADEMAADGLLKTLTAKAEQLHFDKNPRQKASADLVNGHAQLLKKYPDTAAARKARAMAKEWRLEAEPGK